MKGLFDNYTELCDIPHTLFYTNVTQKVTLSNILVKNSYFDNLTSIFTFIGPNTQKPSNYYSKSIDYVAETNISHFLVEGNTFVNSFLCQVFAKLWNYYSL